MDSSAVTSGLTAPRQDLGAQLLDHRDGLLGFVLSMTRDYDVAEEIVQEVSLTVLREASRGFVPNEFFAWVLGLARNRVADHYRSRIRDQRLLEKLAELADVASAAFLAQPPPVQDERRLQYLRQCMDRLSGRARRIAEARYARSLSVAEIAAEVSWKPQSVSVALARSRKLLVACVERKLRSEAHA